MTSQEKAINLQYHFLTYKPEKKTINTCTTFFCMYWYVSIYSENCFWPQYTYPELSPNYGYRWCPLGKLSHLGLEQLHFWRVQYCFQWTLQVWNLRLFCYVISPKTVYIQPIELSEQIVLVYIIVNNCFSVVSSSTTEYKKNMSGLYFCFDQSKCSISSA